MPGCPAGLPKAPFEHPIPVMLLARPEAVVTSCIDKPLFKDQPVLDSCDLCRVYPGNL